MILRLKIKTFKHLLKTIICSKKLDNLRYLYATARSGKFPSFLSCMNTIQNSPRAALLFHVLLGFIFTFYDDLQTLVLIFNLTLDFYFFI